MLRVWVAVVMVTAEKQDFLGTKCYWVQAVMSDEMLNEIMGSSPEINHRWLHCWAPGKWRLFKLHIKIIHINYSGKTKSSWWSHIFWGKAKLANKQTHILVFKFVSIIKGKLNVRLNKHTPSREEISRINTFSMLWHLVVFSLPFVFLHLDSYRVDLCQSFALCVWIWQSLWTVNLKQKQPQSATVRVQGDLLKHCNLMTSYATGIKGTIRRFGIHTGTIWGLDEKTDSTHTFWILSWFFSDIIC